MRLLFATNMRYFFCAKVANNVVVQFACDLKQEASMFLWMDFNGFVRGFKIQ